jgi:hypothetical protein
MSNRAIIDAVKAISGAGKPAVSLHIGTVTAVDEDDYTCTCRLETGGGAAMPGIKLMLNPDDGVACFPAIGSQVLIILQSPGDAYVIMTTELDKQDTIANKEIYLHVDKSTVQLSPDKIVLNDGSYGGLVKVEALVERLNAVEGTLNEFIGIFNNHIHTTTATIGAGPALGVIATTGTPAAVLPNTTTVADIENSDIIHGSI